MLPLFAYVRGVGNTQKRVIVLETMSVTHTAALMFATATGQPAVALVVDETGQMSNVVMDTLVIIGPAPADWTPAMLAATPIP
jgi:hypothetical protein